MPLDGYTLHLLTEELKNSVIGCRIEKIHMPARDELVFHLRSREGAKKLYISASSSIPRINLTASAPENPGTPPMLCMFLRKHLTGCVFTGLRQQGLDRVLFADLRGTDEIGDPVSFTLALEIMAKHSNFTVINSDGIIIEAIKKSDLTTAKLRQIQPGFRYVLPPSQDKLNILEIGTADIFSAIKKLGDIPLSSALLKTLEGISPLISREISCLVTGNDLTLGELTDTHFAKLEKQIDSLREKLVRGGTPTMLIKDGRPFDLSFTDITQYGFCVESKTYGSYSELIDSFYAEKTLAERTGQQNRELQKSLVNMIARSRRKYETRKEEKEKCAEKEKMRIYAELILSNQFSLEKGSLFYDIENYYDDYNKVRIDADPALSPAANAQKYYKEYNKLKNAEKLLDGLISESEIEIE
jgi:predicted ribosome quality control (RQC) complex YloA/Tae2 family protein